MILQVAVLLRAIVGSSIHIGHPHPVRANQFILFFIVISMLLWFHSGDNSYGQRRAQSNECLIITVGHSTIANSTKKLFIVYTTFVATMNESPHLFTHIIIFICDFFQLLYRYQKWISRHHQFVLSAEKHIIWCFQYNHLDWTFWTEIHTFTKHRLH